MSVSDLKVVDFFSFTSDSDSLDTRRDPIPAHKPTMKSHVAVSANQFPTCTKRIRGRRNIFGRSSYSSSDLLFSPSQLKRQKEEREIENSYHIWQKYRG
ncbi:hypothetical protein Bca101_077027 [Brassica carinata]